MKLVMLDELYYGHMDDPDWERKPIGRVLYDVQYPPWKELIGIPHSPQRVPDSTWWRYFDENPDFTKPFAY